MLSRCPGLSGTLVLTALLAAPSAAHATQSRTVSGMVTLGGEVTYDTLTVTSTGTIGVGPYVMGSMTSTGWLDLKANTITIESGGAIVADGAGYPGVDAMAGGCSVMSVMCAQPGMGSGDPGGGGGFFGKGANGASEAMAGTCVDLGAKAAGGAAFFSMASMALDLGSAGGASNISGPATAGYAGGGGIHLSAAVIVIDGKVTANGAGWDGTMPHFGGVGPGGGSGGAIEIAAASLTGKGMIAVNGGAGAHGNGVPGSPNNGGGGSGGVVLLRLPPSATNPVMVQSAGGKTGDCTNLVGSPGGTVLAPFADGCIDVDGDGFESKQCGGMDCDDSDPNVHPDTPEICNGIDDNCDGHVDEAPNDCTKMGLVCGKISGVPGCVAPADAGSDGGDVPRDIEFGGGCALDARGDLAGAMAAGMLALVALATRRRGSKRRG